MRKLSLRQEDSFSGTVDLEYGWVEGGTSSLVPDLPQSLTWGSRTQVSLRTPEAGELRTRQKQEEWVRKMYQPPPKLCLANQESFQTELSSQPTNECLGLTRPCAQTHTSLKAFEIPTLLSFKFELCMLSLLAHGTQAWLEEVHTWCTSVNLCHPVVCANLMMPHGHRMPGTQDAPEFHRAHIKCLVNSRHAWLNGIGKRCGADKHRVCAFKTDLSWDPQRRQWHAKKHK